MIENEDKKNIARVIEALIFASTKPVSSKELSPYLEEFELNDIIEIIEKRYSSDSGVQLQKISSDHFAFRTHPDIAARLNLERAVERPLSRVAMEVLSIIAYHQPITRSEIEEIRGISLSRGTIDILLEHDWIKPRGRRRTPGRPLTWGTTINFLDYFGLSDLDDLPGIEELKSAGLLRKGQSIGELEGQLYPSGGTEVALSEEHEESFYNEDEENFELETLSDDYDELEKSHETENI